MTIEAFEDRMRRGGTEAVVEAARFFMRDDPLYHTLREIAARLDELGVPYAVVGGMALVAHGYIRTTEDVNVLVTPDGLRRIRRELEGRGYLPAFGGSRRLRDTRSGVRIKFVLAGQFPGDGKPKAVAFPEPAAVAVDIDGIRYVPLPTLIELKLASGMTNPARLRDLADVQELIRALQLPADFADQLNPYVRDKFQELWSALAADAAGES